MFIDMHVHLRRAPGFPRKWDGSSYPSPAEVLAIYDSVGIEKGVVLPSVSPECCHVPQSLEDLLAICAESGGRLIPFVNCDPRFLTNSPGAPLDEFLAFYKAKGCRGVGEVTANLPFDNPMVENLFRAAEKVRLPLTFHVGSRAGGCYGLIDEPGLPRLERALGKFPELIFLGHSQPFWAEIGPLERPEAREGYPSGPIARPGRAVEMMRKYPNLHGDLSARSGWNALARDEGFAAEFLDEFQDRLYFGTDLTGAKQETPLVDLLLDMRSKGRITERVFEKVARGNAAKLLGP